MELKQKELDSYLNEMRKIFKSKESGINENNLSSINDTNRIKARNLLREQLYTSKNKNTFVFTDKPAKLDERKEIELLQNSMIKEYRLKEEDAAIKIQIQWKVDRFRRILNQRIKAKSSADILSSDSLYMRNLLRGKIKNPIDWKGDPKNRVKLVIEANKKSLVGASNYDTKLINTSQMIFSNTGKAATLQVYWVKTMKKESDSEEGKEKEITLIEVNIKFDINNSIQILILNPSEIMEKFNLETFTNKIQDLLIDKLEYNHKIRKVIFDKNQKKMKLSLNKKEKEEAAAVMIQIHLKGMLIKKQYKILLQSANKTNRFIYKMIQRYQKLYLEIIFHYMKSEHKIKITARQFDDHHNKHVILVDLINIMSENQYKSMRIFISSRPIGESILKDAFNPVIRIMKKYISIHKEHDEITFSILFNDEPCKQEIIADDTIMNFDNSLELDDSLNVVDSIKVDGSLIEDGKGVTKIQQKEGKSDISNKVAGSVKIDMAESNKSMKSSSKDKFDYVDIMAAIVILQKKFRARKVRELFGLKKFYKKQINIRAIAFGKLYDKTIKRFGDIFYTVCIYKMIIGHDELLNFTASRFREKIDHENIIKGTYVIDNTRLLNTGGMTLTDFLVSKMRIKEKIINFDLNIEENFSNNNNFY